MLTGITQQKVFEILLIEDSPADVRLTEAALRETKVPYRLQSATDGATAIQILKRQPPHQHARRPDLILLDWNLPVVSGREVLKTVKEDPVTKDIPVVVLTSSQEDLDVEGAYDLQANCYIRKPVDIDEFFDVILALERFWLGTAALPRH